MGEDGGNYMSLWFDMDLFSHYLFICMDHLDHVYNGYKILKSFVMI